MRETSAAEVQEVTTRSGKAWEDWRMQPPPEGDPGVGGWVFKQYEALRRHRDKQGLVELWAHFHDLYRGRIFKRRNKFSQVIANLFFKVINSMVANLTDNKPRSNIMPNGDTPDEVADGWQACYDEWWDRTRQQASLQASVGRSERNGFQCDELWFNPDLESGQGEIETVRNDTYGVLFWPGHTEIQTQPGMCTFEAMELGEIYDRWPETKGKVTADPDYSELLKEDRVWTRATRSKFLRPEGSATGYVIPGGDDYGGHQGRGAGIQRALVIKFWVKDYTMKWVDPRNGQRVKKGETLLEPVMAPIGMVDPTTGQPIQQPMMDMATGQPQMQQAVNPQTGEPLTPEKWSKYPGYLRCIIVTNKGNLVLDDMPNPSINPELPRETTSQCYLWDKFPFLKRFSYSDDVGEYGLSLLEQIETLVVELCKKLTQYSSHLDLLCRNPLILPKGCGVNKNDVNNRPQRIWEPVATMAQHIRFLQVPPAPADILQFIETIIRLVDMVSGVTEVSEGRRPAGITAAHAIAALQEKAQVIYREKIRHNDLYLEEQGRMFISLGQNWYTEERKLRYEGKFGDQTFPFKGVEAQGELAFHIEAGSTLPRNRALRQAQIIELAKAKQIPNKVLLKELAIPNHDEVAQQMEMGPLKVSLQKLKQSGLFDDNTIQTIAQILTLNDHDFRKVFGTGNPFADMAHRGAK